MTSSNPHNSLVITTDLSRSRRRRFVWDWHWQALYAGAGLAIASVLLGWSLWTSWQSARSGAQAQLESALAARCSAVEGWYHNRSEMLAAVRDQIGQNGELAADRGELMRTLGFAGYAVISREGQTLCGDQAMVALLKQEADPKSAIQKSLGGSATATGIARRSRSADSESPSEWILFAAPVWLKGSSGLSSEIALPDASIVAWVSAKEEFVPSVATATFGESGRVHQSPLGKWTSSAPGILWRGNLDPSGQPMIAAYRQAKGEKFLLEAKIAEHEAMAPFYRSLWPNLALFLGVLVCAGLLIWRVWHLVWAVRTQFDRALDHAQIGQYAIEERLGEGGMGVVFRAKHRLMRRPAAIKLLDKGRSDATCIARFEREVQLTSLLSHPNTISIYDYGLTDDGVFYYAMEYIDGVSLDSLVQDGPLSEGRAIHLLAQLCGSLHEAHQVGLIHRDIKPANVLVTERGGLYDFVKLLDFGLVKAVQAKSLDITMNGAAVGTPLFMSPEAIETPDDVDSRSDLYSVGAIGYYLLTGKFVFVGKSSTEVCMKHLHERPTPMSMRGPNPISPDLEHLILQCLEKDRDHRPPTAFDLQQSLLACGEAFTWTEDEAADWWSERKETDRTQEFAEAASQSAVASSQWMAL